MPGAPPAPAPSVTGAVHPLPARMSVLLASSTPGEAPDQPAGTDNPPTEDAPPMPAAIAPPTGASAPASGVPNPKTAPRGVVSLIRKPNGAPLMKWPSSGRVAVIMAVFHASVTPTL